MRFGTVTPYELLFRVHVDPETTTEKIAKSDPAPKGNYLQASWLHKTYRNYTLEYSIDPDNIQFTEREGSYDASVQFLTLVYDENGRLVNSLVTTANIHFSKDEYLAATRNGMTLRDTIAVPAHGEYWLRAGIHDLGSGRVGALEIPVSRIELPSRQSAANAVAQPHR
jgi:hypothetical protein